MSDTSEPRSGPHQDRQQLLSFLREADPEPIFSGGDVPEDHTAPYEPSVEELVEGARSAAEANRVLFEAREQIVEERARTLFQPREEEQ